MEKAEIINLLKSFVLSPKYEKTVWRNDPFEFLLENLKAKLDPCLFSSIQSSNIASTSQETGTLNSDARLQFSEILVEIYKILVDWLNANTSENIDEYSLLSLQEMSIILESLQFFVVSGVLPFLQPGVGLGAAGRSAFIKSWKLYTNDIESQRKYLSVAAETFMILLDSNEALRNQIFSKFIDDILAIRFQLVEICIKRFDEKFSKNLELAPKQIVISALMGLCKIKNGKESPPKWLQDACGEELSRILVNKDGLWNYLAYYSDIGGNNWTDNLPLRRFVAKHLASVPKIAKSSSAYHSNIYQQFLEIIDNKATNSPKILQILVCFVEEMNQKYPHNANLVIFDDIFRFFEILNEKIGESGNSEKVSKFDKTCIRNLEILNEILQFSPTERILKIFKVLAILSQNLPICSNILKTMLNQHVMNPGSMIYDFVMSKSRNLRLVNSKSLLIVEIGNEEDSKKKELWIDGDDDQDLGVARRLEFVAEIIFPLFGRESITVWLEILAHGVEDWMATVDGEESGVRFVELDSSIHYSSLHTHLVVGFCFERVGELICENGFAGENERQFVLMLRIVECVLLKTTKRIEELKCQEINLDISRFSAEKSENLELMVESSKMCIGLASGVIMAANMHPKIAEKLDTTLEIVWKFERIANQFPALQSVAADARNLLELMNCEFEPEPQPSTSSGIRESGDVCMEILESLRKETEEAPLRGAALIQAARVFRLRNEKLAEKLIENGIFEDVEKHLSDSDSYVFLAAINCLGEIACYKREFLDQLIEIYSKMDSPEDTIRIGRIGEVLGKVFRTIGQISVLYVDRVVAVFVQSMRNSDEIVRASCCCALGDILVASRGRGIEKWLDEVLYLLDSVILVVKEGLTRRAAVDLVRQIVRSCDSDILQVIGTRLRDIRRRIISLWKYDRDDVVRLHAQLCMEELSAALQNIFEEETSHYCRRIKI